jgi:hypothetical protein
VTDQPLSRLATTGSLDSGSLVGLNHVLDLALLAVLFACGISISLCTLSLIALVTIVFSGSGTHRPLGKPEIGISSALGNEALVVLQTPAHGAGGDCEVAVVARRGEEDRAR